MHGTLEFGSSIARSTFGGLPVRKLVLAICLVSVAAPFAAAQNGGNGGNGNNNQNGQNSQKHNQHAAEMSGAAMTVAGMIALGGYFLIRRRISPQN
jgi:hypothetical protein